MLWYYILTFALSLVLSFIYLCKWRKHYDIHFTLIFLLIPLIMAGYLSLAVSRDLPEAVLANKVIYMGGCFLLSISTLYIFEVCHVQTDQRWRILFFLLNVVFYLCVLSIGYSDIFYKNVSIYSYHGVTCLNKEYGFMHTLFLGFLILESLASFSALVHAYRNKKDVSIRNIHLLFIAHITTFCCFFIQKVLDRQFQLLPVAYILDQIIFLIICNRLVLYDINSLAVETINEKGDIGFICFDFTKNFLGCNNSVRNCFPQFKQAGIDRKLDPGDELFKKINGWLDSFESDNAKNERYYAADDHSYQINLAYLYDGKNKRGYQLMIADTTEDQDLMKRLSSYYSEVEASNTRRLQKIREMNDNFVMAMATMVESRDNSTGGHIRRTSDVVAMLIDEIKKDDDLGLDDDFCTYLIKAAPMHDLGKIAVDDAILRKPGKLTTEEYEQMKTHAPKGAQIVHEVLQGIDNERFRQIAENVAHYHHEKWDGSGYPDGLKGEQIPLEARIMAVADFYDALVSKRYYKPAMPFDQATEIILEGMGTFFDKRMEKYFLAAREKLEEYYDKQPVE